MHSKISICNDLPAYLILLLPIFKYVLFQLCTRGDGRQGNVQRACLWGDLAGEARQELCGRLQESRVLRLTGIRCDVSLYGDIVYRI